MNTPQDIARLHARLRRAQRRRQYVVMIIGAWTLAWIAVAVFLGILRARGGR